jgi:hypothetical protein
MLSEDNLRTHHIGLFGLHGGNAAQTLTTLGDETARIAGKACLMRLIPRSGNALPRTEREERGASVQSSFGTTPSCRRFLQQTILNNLFGGRKHKDAAFPRRRKDRQFLAGSLLDARRSSSWPRSRRGKYSHSLGDFAAFINPPYESVIGAFCIIACRFTGISVATGNASQNLILC